MRLFLALPDTYRNPNGDGSITNSVDDGMEGAWNVYVGLPSGKVLISDTNYGLFVVTVDDDTISPTTSSPTTSSLSPTTVPSMKTEMPNLDVPSNVCQDHHNDKFEWKNGKKNCKTLQKKDKDKIEKICKTEIKARAVCPVTCDSCSSIPTCEDNPKDKFKWEHMKISCKKLNKESDDETEKICKLREDARIVCPITCHQCMLQSPSSIPLSSQNPSVIPSKDNGGLGKCGILESLDNESSECPDNPNIARCTKVLYGELCKGKAMDEDVNGMTCDIDENLNNCANYDIYRKKAPLYESCKKNKECASNSCYHTKCRPKGCKKKNKCKENNDCCTLRCIKNKCQKKDKDNFSNLQIF